MICISVVDHGHGPLVTKLIHQLSCLSSVSQIILTINIPGPFLFNSDDLIHVIHNTSPLGFGENHNNAYKHCTQPFFCVLNPDIELLEDPFPILVQCLLNTNNSAIGPVIISPNGSIEDSARYYPSVSGLLKKLLFSRDGRWPINFEQQINYPDWLAGMFILFKSEIFKKIEGFDTRYFLYYEDVDICKRLSNHGYQLGLCTTVKVIHNARRTSRRSLRYMLWHFKSMFRFLFLKSK